MSNHQSSSVPRLGTGWRYTIYGISAGLLALTSYYLYRRLLDRQSRSRSLTSESEDEREKVVKITNQKRAGA
jgi:hypothetical protein